MPHRTATINGEQREAIYEFLVEGLSRLTDVPLAIKTEDFDTAKRLAREFSQYFRLLDDLGWSIDCRREVALTMPPEELADMLRRLYADADGALGGSPEEREARETEEADRRRDQLVLDTASSLLAELLAGGGEEAI
jgi:hypothetical protein